MMAERNALPPFLLVVALCGLSCQGPEEKIESAASESPPAPTSVPATQPAAPPAEPEEDKDRAPYPFSSDVIRDATAVGRSFTLKFEMEGARTTFHQVEFLAVDELGATTRGTNWTEGGEKKQTEEQRVTWGELQAHASYPLGSTAIRIDRVQTPMGKLPAMLYEQIGNDGQPTARAWFAMSMPGAPVLTEDLVAGEVKFRSTMIESVMPEKPHVP